MLFYLPVQVAAGALQLPVVPDCSHVLVDTPESWYPDEHE